MQLTNRIQVQFNEKMLLEKVDNVVNKSVEKSVNRQMISVRDLSFPGVK